MDAREQAAFNTGIEVARQMAMTPAVTVEVRDDAQELRQQAAVAVLQDLPPASRTRSLRRPRHRKEDLMFEPKTLPMTSLQPEQRKVTGFTEARISARANDAEAMSEVMAEQALQDALRRKRREAPRYDVKMESREGGALKLSPSFGEEVTDLARRLNAFGTP